MRNSRLICILYQIKNQIRGKVIDNYRELKTVIQSLANQVQNHC